MLGTENTHISRCVVDSAFNSHFEIPFLVVWVVFLRFVSVLFFKITFHIVI